MMKSNILAAGATFVAALAGLALPSGAALANPQATDGPFDRGNRSCPGVIYKQEGKMCIPSNGKKASRKVYPLPGNRQCDDGYKPVGAYCEEKR